MEFDTLLWAVLGCGCISSGLYAIWGTLRERQKLRGIVRLSLDCAYHGEQFAPGGYLHGLDASEIACDMTLHCEDAHEYEPEDLEPHVRRWLDSRADVLLGEITFKRQEAAE